MCLTEYEEERVLAGKFAEGVEKGIGIGVEKGRLNAFVELVKDGVLSVMEAARRADMTVPEFEAAAGLKGE